MLWPAVSGAPSLAPEGALHLEPTIASQRPVCEQTEVGVCRTCADTHPIQPIPIDGRKLAPSRSTWLDAVDYLARAHCNRQRHRNLMRLAWQLATRTDRTMMTAPKRGATWAVLAEEVDVSRRTIAYLLAWMREHRLLVTVVTGSTPRTRPGNLWGMLDDGLGNLAAEYALTIPDELLDDDLEAAELDDTGEEEEIPWPCETLPERPASSHVSEDVEKVCTPAVHGCSREESLPNAGAGAHARTVSASPCRTWPRHVTPGNKRDQIAACERLRQDNRLTLGVLSARDLRSLLRPLFIAGFSVADVEHALNRMPDGRHWGDIDPGRWVGTAARARVLRSRIRHRVSLWVDADGRPLARSASQQAQDAEDAMWRAQARRLALVWLPEQEPDVERQAAAPVVERRMPPAEYLAARAALQEKLGRLKEGA